MASSSSPQEILGYQHQRERSNLSPKQYDAFINHRGPEVKDTLAKQLYDLLQERGCQAFLDCEEIEGGDYIPFAVRNGICSSVVQIAIFSKGYAESSLCLNELVLMLEQPDALFIPVFYDVHPLELRDIKNGNSAYSAAFSGYQSEGMNLHKLNRWKKALTAASYFSGYELSQHKDNLCEKIVSGVLQVVQEKEKWTPLHVAEYPVGLADLVQYFESSCSETEKDKVKMVGIFGLGGSGKTTLAKELFNMKRLGYNASCFLSDVRESHAKGELHCLQSQLFKDLFHEDRKFKNVDEGKGELEHRLARTRHLDFLIVLDDIDHLDQLNAMLFEGMLGPGSLVIITTRDQGVLRGADVTIRYSMKVMDRNHAKELFCSHAFRGRDPPIAYEKLVYKFVKFCGGLPLSLKVVGAHLYGRNEDYWELELEKVKIILPKDIMQSLKISFDGLNSQEKQIFIDIACFLNMKLAWYMKNRAASIWNASGWSAEHAVQKLQDKCLVVVSGYFQSFEMHDHLRDLGRQMADELGPPRLWQPDLLRSMEAKGFKQILAETKGRCFHSFEDSSLKTRVTYFIGSLNDSAEADLLLLEIDNYLGNLKSIPSWIPLRKLRYLTVRHMEEIWSTFQRQLQINTQACLELRVLTIFDSPSLQNLPDLIGMCTHLEVLYISGSLENTDITSFIQPLKQLSNLRSLELWFGGRVFFSGNLNLSKDGDSTNSEASTSSCMNSLETVLFRRLDNISKLVISGEICPRLRSLEVFHMYNLNEMDLKQLERLNNLQVLGCDKLETLSGLKQLKGLNTLTVQRCLKLETISGLSSLTGLRELRTESCNGLKSLPNLADLCHLERIAIVECEQLQSLEGVEKLQGLKSLVIGARDSGDASVFDCIHGLRKLPSEFAILTGKPVDGASSRLDVHLFSEMIGARAVTEIERQRKGVIMTRSSGAITVYALLVTSEGGTQLRAHQTSLVSFQHLQAGKSMVTVLLTEGKTRVTIPHHVTVEGFKATLNEEEEGRALTVLQRIVDRLYGQSMVPKLEAAYDVASESGNVE